MATRWGSIISELIYQDDYVNTSVQSGVIILVDFIKVHTIFSFPFIKTVDCCGGSNSAGRHFATQTAEARAS